MEKTSLLVDFARQSKIPTCWLSLDVLDQDPQRFCTYLIAALEQGFPKFGKQSKAVLRSLVNLEQDMERILAALVNEISSQIDQHFALVVDDYQFVDSVPDIAIFSAGSSTWSARIATLFYPHGVCQSCPISLSWWHASK